MLLQKIKLLSKKTRSLSKKTINEICKLKTDAWKYKFKEQKKWFSENIKDGDLHNFLYLKKKLIGYTCLRKRELKYSSQNLRYLLFDTLIIKKKKRGLNYGSELMKYNNKIIRKNKLPSFLLTTKKIEPFYLKNKWKKTNNKFKFINHEVKKKLLMFYNFREKKKNYKLILKA